MKNMWFTMKKLYAFLLLLMCVALASCTPKGDANITMENGKLIVRSPRYKFAPTNLELLRVELDDSATVLYFKVEGFANTSYGIRPEAHLVAMDGKSYRLTGTGGIDTDKIRALPAEGVAYFSLSFEPLPEGTESFDFVEAPDSDWKMEGIRIVSGEPEGMFRYTLKGVLPDSMYHGREFPIALGKKLGWMIGKIKVEGNRFEYHGVADSAMHCSIHVGESFGNFIVEEGEIQVDMMKDKTPSGTPLNEAYAEYNSLIDQINARLKAIRDSVIHGDMDREARIKRLGELEFGYRDFAKVQKEILKPFIIRHANDEAGAVAAKFYLQIVLAASAPEFFDDIYPHFGPWILAHRQVRFLSTVIRNSRNMMVGAPLLDFEGEDRNGNKVKLSDYVGRGKYVLVDYSANWCRPCKAEIPNLHKLYRAYKGKDFELVTVMVTEEPEASMIMLDEYQIDWPCILNVGSVPMELYGFNSIPRIMLFSPDGKIVSNSLRGEAIGEKLKEVLPRK